MSPGPDVFLAADDAGLKFFLREVGFPLQRDRAIGLDVAGVQIVIAAALQLIAHRIDLSAGVAVGRFGRFVFVDVGVDDDDHGLLDVVEEDHLVVEREAQVRQLPIVFGGVRKILGVADDVVSGVTDRTAAETGKTGKVRRRILTEQLLQFTERVLDGERGDIGAAGDGDVTFAGFDPQEGLPAEKAVPSDFLSPHNTFEQERLVIPAHAVVGRDRRQRIAEQLPVHRHQTVRARQRGERVDVGMVRAH